MPNKQRKPKSNRRDPGMRRKDDPMPEFYQKMSRSPIRPMTTPEKPPAAEMKLACGGRVKMSGGGKAPTCKGMGAATKGGKYRAD